MTTTLERPTPAPEAPEHGGARIARRRERRKLVILAAGLVTSALALVAAVTIGTAGIGMGDVLRSVQLSLFGGTLSADFASTYAVITQLRLPRVLLAFAAGAARPSPACSCRDCCGTLWSVPSRSASPRPRPSVRRW